MIQELTHDREAAFRFFELQNTPGRNHDRSSPTSHLADYCNGPAGSIQPIVQGGRDLCLTPVVGGVILDQPKVCCER